MLKIIAKRLFFGENRKFYGRQKLKLRNQIQKFDSDIFHGNDR